MVLRCARMMSPEWRPSSNAGGRRRRNLVRIDGRVALSYSAHHQFVWVSGKGRILKLWMAVVLIGVGVLLLRPAVGAVVLVAFLVAVPLSVELSLWRVWRRLTAGEPAVEVGYELTEEGMRVSVGGVSTQHRWESLRPVRDAAGY